MSGVLSRRTTRLGTVPETGPARAASPTAATASAALGRRRLVVLLTVLMYLFGLVMITSAASGTSLLQENDQWEYFRRQLAFGIIGFVAMLVALKLPVLALRRLAWPMLVLTTILLFVVFVPGLGHTANGATRWIALPGGFQMQPSEFVKLAIVLYLADHLSRTPPPLHWWRDFLRSPGGVAIFLTGVIFIQRDLGSAMVAGAVVLTLYMLAGTNWRLLFGTLGPGLALVALGILAEPFRRARFTAFLDPWAVPHDGGYQLVQALIAIGSGGVFGLGLGHSVQKVHFLPESHTDMIFAIVVEELGLVGVLVVLGGFCSLALLGTRIALRAETRFEALLAAGLTAMLCGQAVLNIAGVVGVLPLTGVPLPLVSYGGSNLLVSLTALGLLANLAVAQHGPRRVRSHPAAGAGAGGRWRHRRASRAGAGSS